MSEPLVTQCPACRTRFKISRYQLDAANGAVRCGACLEVFAGADCLIDQANHDHFSIGYEGDTGYEAAGLSPGANQQIDPAAHPETDWQSQPATDEDHITSLPDLMVAGHAEPVENSDDDSFTDWYQGTEIIYLLEDDELDESAPMRGADSMGDSAGVEDFLEDLSMQSLNESIDEISLAMVEVPLHKGRFGYYLTYSLLILLLLVSLGGQYLWFNKDQLAAREDLRHYYVRACQVLEPRIGCNLPDYVNLSDISTRKLIVRSHPAIRNALIIDAIILNSADFAQPFPRLELKFTDLDFKTVASRRFEAREYLGGELTGLKFIPARTEVRVSLEIVDPGNLAVSYELYAVHP